MKYGCHELYLMNNIQLNMEMQTIRNTKRCRYNHDGNTDITVLLLALDR